MWVSSLFYDALSVTRLYSVNDRAISKWWLLVKYLVRSGHSLILRYYPGIRLEGLRKTWKTSIRIAGHRGQYLNPRTSQIQSRSVNHSTMTFSTTLEHGIIITLLSFFLKIMYKLLSLCSIKWTAARWMQNWKGYRKKGTEQTYRNLSPKSQPKNWIWTVYLQEMHYYWAHLLAQLNY
jgi:hypothetical protein